MVNLSRYRATWRGRHFIEQIHAPIFLKAVLAIEIMLEPQSNLDERDNDSILKDYISSRRDPSIFTSIACTGVIRPIKQNLFSFSSIKINKVLSAQSTVSCRSD